MNPYNNIFQYLGNNLENMATNLMNFLRQGDNRKKFLSGLLDGHTKDDAIKVFTKTVIGSALRPSQNAIYFEKTLNPIITWEELRTQILKKSLIANSIIISNDNFIIDGHHRWASSQLLRRDCKITCTCIDLPIKYALPILDAILISIRQFKPAPSTANNIWSVKKTSKDIEEVFSNIADRISLTEEGFTVKASPPELFDYNNYKDPLYITLEGKVLDGLFKLIYPSDFTKATIFLSNNLVKIPKPDSNMPPRKQMPQFNDKTLKFTKEKLKAGAFDIKKPQFSYSDEILEIKKTLHRLNKAVKRIEEWKKK